MEVGELLDMRHYAFSKRTGERLNRSSRETIMGEYLGYYMQFDREISRSNWDNYNLSLEQIMQAYVDALVSFLIGNDLFFWK